MRFSIASYKLLAKDITRHTNPSVLTKSDEMYCLFLRHPDGGPTFSPDRSNVW